MSTVLSDDKPVFIIHNNFDNAVKVLFAGTAITYCNSNPDTGWNNSCGMAASCAENDYVHLTVNNLAKKYKYVNYAILDVTEWEKNCMAGVSLDKYNDARDFNADIIIMQIGENIVFDDFNEGVFKSAYIHFADFLNKSTNAKFILTSCFWRNTVDDCIKKIAEKRRYPFVYLGNYGDDGNQMAIGEFENSNVAMHPSDKGMNSIANDICAAMDRIVLE